MNASTYVPRQFVRLWHIAFLLPLLFIVCITQAQVAGTGSIQGSVVDSTGAAIPGATVTIVRGVTDVKHTATSDSSGLFDFPNLEVGTYTLTVTAPGFATYISKSNTLEVGSNININAKLPVGEANTHVEVTAEGLALQTEDVSFKQTIDQNAVTEMPINGRQMTSLITLAGGASAAPAGDFTGSKYSYATISVSIAGGGGNTTAWRLDGGDNNDYMGNGNLPFPFPDAVNQFSVESTVLGAQSGQHSGGLVNVVTRSGTNTYHGTAFEFIRNPIIDATNYFATGKDTLHQDEYGGTFGGKIIRDKLFAFAGYQHNRAVQAQNSTQAQVPTAANLLGDYSVTDPVATAANPIGTKTPSGACKGTYSQLLDPLTGAVLPGNKYATPPTYNAASLALDKYLPKIDPTYDTGNCGNVHYAIPSEVFDNQFVTRVDYTINPKQHFYARYLYDGYTAPAFYSPTNILITTQSGNREKVQTFTMGEDWTINSNTVNSSHATLLRRLDNRGYNTSDINATTLGINLYQYEPVGLYISATKFTLGGGTNSLAHFNDNTLALDDDLTLVRGKHTIVIGGEFVRNQLNIFNNYEDNGNFAFGNQFSAYGPTGTKPTGGVTNTGDSTLDYLMGAQSSFQQSKAQQNALRGSIPSIYAQDTYHPSKRLTLVAGLRWSPNFAPYDYFNRGTAFSMAAFLANQTSSVYPNAPAGALYYGDPGVPRAYTKSTPVQFSPNAGVSFDPRGDGKTVIRAGAELIYDQPNFFTAQRLEDNPPFATAISQVQTSTSGPISFSAPWSAGSITTNPFPQPAVPTPSQALFFPQSQFIFTPATFKPSYTIQYTLSVQHQFAHDIEFQVDYIGNGTRHAPVGTPLDAATFVPGVWGVGGTGCPGVVTTGPAGKPAGAAGTACSTVANQSQRFALTEANPLQGNQYLGGGGGTVLVNDNAMADYNALVTTVQHRLSKTFSVLANWTWSKCLNIEDSQGDLAGTSVQNPNNLAGDYAPCGSDYRHIENVVIVARSNFALPRLAALAINNWELAPLTHIVSGAPFTVTTGVDNSLTDVGNDRPNVIPGVDPYLHLFINSGSASITNRGYLNAAAFCQSGNTTCNAPAIGTFGNAGRNAFRGPAAYQFDAQISRIFPIYERLTTTLRLEAYNVLNHPNFSNPTSALNSSTFGQVSSTSNAARVFQGSLKFSF
jgi:hypothetical protein